MALVERFRTSGTTQEQFSKDQGIAFSLLRYWLAKTRSETEGTWRFAFCAAELAGGNRKRDIRNIALGFRCCGNGPHPPNLVVRHFVLGLNRKPRFFSHKSTVYNLKLAVLSPLEIFIKIFLIFEITYRKITYICHWKRRFWAFRRNDVGVHLVKLLFLHVC
jgi:hypothetical protein